MFIPNNEVLCQFPILLITDRFKPFIACTLTGNFYRQMGKPTIICSTMPMFCTGRNMHNISWA